MTKRTLLLATLVGLYMSPCFSWSPSERLGRRRCRLNPLQPAPAVSLSSMEDDDAHGSNMSAIIHDDDDEMIVHEFNILPSKAAPPSPRCTTRRNLVVLSAGAAISFLTTMNSFAVPAHAAAPTTPGEAIRRSAANLPGLGPSDLFYPQAWQGSWKVTRNLLQPSNVVLPEYTIRFLPSIEESKVILDRGYSQAQLETAIVNFKEQQQSTSSSSAIQSYQWVETNPNDLRLVFTNGGLKDIKVTKRSSSTLSEDPLALSTSEFQRVTLQSTATSIPTIGARRVLTQWKQVDANTLQALEVVYDMDASTTSLSSVPPSSANNDGGTPPVLSKSRILLERIIN